MRERIIIVFIAIAIGLLVTTLVYFLYQQTKTIPSKVATIIPNSQPTPTPEIGGILTIDTPSNESILNRRSISVKGKTEPENTVIISTNQEDVVVKPTSDGKFSATITIDAGTNKIITRSITPSGEEITDIRIVTYSTEEF